MAPANMEVARGMLVSLFGRMESLSVEIGGLKASKDKIKSLNNALGWMNATVLSKDYFFSMVDKQDAELEARDKVIGELTEKLAASNLTITDLSQQLSELEQQLKQLQANIQQPQPSPASTSATIFASFADIEQIKAPHKSILSDLESSRDQLAVSEAAVTRCRQQQAAVAADVVEPLQREVEQLRKLAAEAAPLKRRATEAESAAEALQRQAAETEQQLRRQVEMSRGRAAALESRVAAAAAEASSNYKTCKFDHDILTYKYGKLIGEKIVLQGLYDLLVFAPSPLSYDYVVGALCWAHDALRDLAAEAARIQQRQAHFRKEAKKGVYGFGC